MDLYPISVPVFVRYLGQLSKLLDIAQTHATQHDLHASVLLRAKLAPDMLDFAKQVEITVNFAIRACAPLANQRFAFLPVDSEHFAGLHDHINRAVRFLQALQPEQMANSNNLIVQDQAGDAKLVLEGRDHLLQYTLPNFFFHFSMAYAMLRHAGVDIGKGDFDGLHQYPAQK